MEHKKGNTMKGDKQILRFRPCSLGWHQVQYCVGALLAIMVCAALAACGSSPTTSTTPSAMSTAQVTSAPTDELSPARYTLPGARVFPEGVAYQPATGALFVNSIVDGTMYRGHVDRPALEVFLPGGQDGRGEVVGMKVDDRNYLILAGGATGRVYVYDTVRGALVANLWNGLADGQSFLNDLALTPDGAAYITDSYTPTIYRMRPDHRTLEPWLDLRNTVVYSNGINLNGIAATADGRFLLTVNLNTGRLYRITVADQSVIEVDLGGQRLTGGDGVLLDGTALYVVQFFANQIVRVQLNTDLSQGAVDLTLTDPSLNRPTTIALVGDAVLVVNSQFDRRGGILATADSPPPDLPFTVTRIALPTQ